MAFMEYRRVFRVAAGAVVAALLLVIVACEESVSRSPAPEPPPEPPPDPPPAAVVVQDDVAVVPASATVASVTADTVSFAQPVEHAPGEVLVFDRTAQTPNGLLRKVTAVSADGRAVTTEPATLEDVIENGTLEIGGRLTPADLTAESLEMLRDMGIVTPTLRPAAVGGFDYYWEFPTVDLTRVSGGVPFGFTLDGSMALSIDYKLVAEYRLGKLTDIEFTVTPRERVNLRMEVSAGVPKDLVPPRIAPMETALFPRPLVLASFTFPAGPVPVLVQPSFQVYLGVNAIGHVTLDLVQEGSIKLGVECDANCSKLASWDPIADESFDFSVNEATIGATVKAYVRPELTIALYDAVGAYGGVEPYALVGGRGGLINGQFGVAAHVKVGIDAVVGFRAQVPILGWTLADIGFDFEVLKEQTIWQSGGPLHFEGQGIGGLAFEVNSTIEPVTLPQAKGGNGSISYGVEGSLPRGLRFDSNSRRLYGTPLEAGDWSLTYAATDEAGARATLPLVIRVNALSGGKVYWTDYMAGTIERANLDGSDREVLIRNVLDSNSDFGIAVHGGKIYWTEDVGSQFWEARIERANLDGSGREVVVGSGLYLLGGIAVHGGKIYWFDNWSKSIERANLDGSDREVLIRSGLRAMGGIAVYGGKIYWTDFGTNTVERANLDGSGREVLIEVMHSGHFRIAVHGGKMYWGYGSIERANLDGSGREMIVSFAYPDGIAVYGGKIYWTDPWLERIERTNLDGSNREVILSGVEGASGIAIVP